MFDFVLILLVPIEAAFTSLRATTAQSSIETAVHTNQLKISF